MLELFANDSFFTLSPWGRVGLLALSTTLAVTMVFLARIVGGRLRRPPILAPSVAAIVLFWAFLWLSPQVYYIYYLWLFPDLPMQWVIHEPPSISAIFELLTFQGKTNLARLGQGGLAWSMFVAALWRANSTPFPRFDLDQSSR